jgi:hypothetical protein
MYSCPYAIPDSIPGEREFVGVRVGLDGASQLHHILLMECPGEGHTAEGIGHAHVLSSCRLLCAQRGAGVVQ